MLSGEFVGHRQDILPIGCVEDVKNACVVLVGVGFESGIDGLVDGVDGEVFCEGRTLDKTDASVFHVTFVFVSEK